MKPTSVVPTTANLWLDADFSGMVWSGLDCDDDLALLAVLAQQGVTLNLAGISVCGGNAPLSHAWANLQALWNHIHFDALPRLSPLYRDIVPLRGYGWRSMQVSRSWLRWLNLVSPDLEDSEDAIDAIVNYTVTVSGIDDMKYNVLTLGPPTNIARAFERVGKLPENRSRILRDSIGHVYMMGGELTGSRLDLNFISDRAAARNIVENQDVPVTLVTIQLCGQVVIDTTFVQNFENKCCRESNGSTKAAACAILPKMKQQVFFMPRVINPSVERKFPTNGPWRHSSKMRDGFVPWDVIAVLVMTHPQLFSHFSYHKVDFPRCDEGEPCDGAMTILEDLGPQLGERWRNHSGIVRVPHLVINETLVLETIHELLCQVPALQGQSPRMSFGFFNHVFGLLFVVLGSMIFWRLSAPYSIKKGNTID